MGRAAIVVAALCAVVAGSWVVVAGSVVGILVFPAQPVEGSCVVQPPAVPVAALGVAFPVGAVAGLAAAVAALWWIRLARANATVLSAVPRRLSRCWPPRVLLDIWAASGEHLPWERVVRAWWASVWVCGLITGLLVLVAEAGSDDGSAAVLVVLLAVMGNGAAALFAVTVLKIAADQGAFRSRSEQQVG